MRKQLPEKGNIDKTTTSLCNFLTFLLFCREMVKNPRDLGIPEIDLKSKSLLSAHTYEITWLRHELTQSRHFTLKNMTELWQSGKAIQLGDSKVKEKQILYRT